MERARRTPAWERLNGFKEKGDAMFRRFQAAFASLGSLALLALSAGPTNANAGLVGHFVHNYPGVDITLDVFDDQPGGRYLWQYTVDNQTFDPIPGTSNGFSGFELALPDPIVEVADITPNPGSAPPWAIDCCSGFPGEWDISDVVGNGVMPGSSGVFSFTTAPRGVAINDSGWFHSWADDVQSPIVPTPGMHVPWVQCGDGNLGADEQCDDGNIESGDGCSFVCRLEFESHKICVGRRTYTVEVYDEQWKNWLAAGGQEGPCPKPKPKSHRKRR